ncbi:MAG: DUF3313 domain-containing protein [Deltaproteobacteria bacterium]|nr:MAG: DUF3313 domain-containing protein [Deltaproteobacteria bacterium]
MTVRIRRRALLALVLAAIAAPGVTARPRRVRPIRLKLEGYVEHAPADTPIVATLTLRHRERSRPFAVKKLTVLTPPPSAGDVLAAVRPYPTSFVLQLVRPDGRPHRSARAAEEIRHSIRALVVAAVIEGEVTDAVSGELLAAGVDRRGEREKIRTWGDVRSGLDRWGTWLAGRLLQGRTGHLP